MDPTQRSWAGLWLTLFTALVGALVAFGVAAVALLWLAMAADGVNDSGGLFSCTDAACVRAAWLVGATAAASVVAYLVVVVLAAVSTLGAVRWAMRLGYLTAAIIGGCAIVAGATGDGEGYLLLAMVPVLGLLGLGSELRIRARGARGLLLAVFD